MSLLQDAEHAVLRDPWPDAPRLAFADAVAATDPARAAYIRADLAVSRAARAAKQPKASDVSASRKAYSGNWQRWMGGLEAVLPPGPPKVAFGRGFVEQVSAAAAWLLDHAPDVFARAPVLDLRVTDLAGHEEAFFDAPWLSRIRALWLAENKLGDHGAECIASSPFLARVRLLDLGFNGIGADGLDALATSPKLPSLRFVHLRGNRAPDPNYETDRQEATEWGPISTNASALFLQRYPGCPWIGRYAADRVPRPGALQDAAGGLLP
jgi:hypothetical protein